MLIIKRAAKVLIFSNQLERPT